MDAACDKTSSLAGEGPLTDSDRVEIIGHSDALRKALDLADRFAPSSIPILLVGETGSGKELFAQRIHVVSGRRGRFVPVNCAALPRDMVESLLFGHHRGAFTGAVEAATGFVEAAEGGTLFLDELSSLAVEAQVKLLRVLESKQVTRLGETRTRLIDFRVIASAQDDVQARVEAGLFRFDLYERVAGVVLRLPALRERTEDVVLLAAHFATLEGHSLGPGVETALLGYDWPGNVRELRAAIERACMLATNSLLEATSVTEAIALGLVASAFVNRSETSHAALVALCRAHGWRARDVAVELGIGVSTLYQRLSRAGISLRQLRYADLSAKTPPGNS
jgi:DNA-binding NtrC family response regulator